MPAFIIGLGTAVPSKSVKTEDFIEHAKALSCSNRKQENILAELYRRSSIKRRNTILSFDTSSGNGSILLRPRSREGDAGPGTKERMRCYEEEVGPLALSASESALASVDLKGNAITHLITVSCTGFYAPGFDIQLIKELAMRSDVQRTQIGFMGCHGALNAMRVASAFCQADPQALVLLCAAEICSVHFQYGWNSHSILANSLFADGAAAMVIAAKAPAVEKASPGWQLLRSYCALIPETQDAIQWRIGSHGFEMNLSAKTPQIIEKHLPWSSPQLVSGERTNFCQHKRLGDSSWWTSHYRFSPILLKTR